MCGCPTPGHRHVASARQARRASRQEERRPVLGDATLLLTAYTRATAPAGLPTGRNTSLRVRGVVRRTLFWHCFYNNAREGFPPEEYATRVVQRPGVALRGQYAGRSLSSRTAHEHIGILHIGTHEQRCTSTRALFCRVCPVSVIDGFGAGLPGHALSPSHRGVSCVFAALARARLPTRTSPTSRSHHSH